MNVTSRVVWKTSRGYFLLEEEAMQKKNRNKEYDRYGFVEYETPRRVTVLTDGNLFFEVKLIDVHH